MRYEKESWLGSCVVCGAVCRLSPVAVNIYRSFAYSDSAYSQGLVYCTTYLFIVMNGPFVLPRQNDGRTDLLDFSR